MYGMCLWEQYRLEAVNTYGVFDLPGWLARLAAHLTFAPLFACPHQPHLRYYRYMIEILVTLHDSTVPRRSRCSMLMSWAPRSELSSFTRIFHRRPAFSSGRPGRDAHYFPPSLAVHLDSQPTRRAFSAATHFLRSLLCGGFICSPRQSPPRRMPPERLAHARCSRAVVGLLEQRGDARLVIGGELGHLVVEGTHHIAGLARVAEAKQMADLVHRHLREGKRAPPPHVTYH